MYKPDTRCNGVAMVSDLTGMHALPRWPGMWCRRDSPLVGLVLCLAIALAAMGLGRIDWLQEHGMGALTLAILCGLVIGNTAYAPVAQHSVQGVTFSKQTLLRLGIILYGFRLSFQEIGRVGWTGVAADALVLGSTFAIALFVGIRVLKLDRATVMLIGAGSSICGAAAVLASAPIVDAEAEQTVTAVSTVVVFGTMAIFIYPLLYHLNWFGLASGSSTAHFGIFAGSTIHEVAQVVAAAGSIDAKLADLAVIAKMVRVIMLAPFLLLLSMYAARLARATGAGQVGKRPINIPWFAFAFIAIVALNSFAHIPAAWQTLLTNFDTAVLAMAMAALGLTTQVSVLRTAGFRPLLLGAALFGWLLTGGALISRMLMGS
ncbi:MAG TPA: YeiH family protein [Burkholderiaceae bacterium]